MSIFEVAKQFYNNIYNSKHWYVTPNYFKCNEFEMLMFCSNKVICYWATPFGKMAIPMQTLGRCDLLIKEYKKQGFTVEDVTDSLNIVYKFAPDKIIETKLTTRNFFSVPHHNRVMLDAAKTDFKYIDKIYSVRKNNDKYQSTVIFGEHITNQEQIE